MNQAINIVSHEFSNHRRTKGVYFYVPRSGSTCLGCYRIWVNVTG